MLQHLFDERDGTRRRAAHAEPEERFSAACRIAAVLALSGADQVTDRGQADGTPALP